jgi:hypothetical protein
MAARGPRQGSAGRALCVLQTSTKCRPARPRRTAYVHRACLCLHVRRARTDNAAQAARANALSASCVSPATTVSAVVA